MAKAEIHETLPVKKEALFKAICKYEDYPEFVDGCTSAKVDRSKPGVARVTYDVSMIKDVHYVLDIREDEKQGVIEWSLVESDMFKVNNGRWDLKPKGENSTEVKYSLEIEFKVPVPSLILNRLIKSSLPAMLKNFEKRAKG